MQELLQEISGTLSRDAQRRNASLNVFLKAQEDKAKRPPRPSRPQACRSLDDAMFYRHQLIREVSHMVSTIADMHLRVPRVLLQTTPVESNLTAAADARAQDNETDTPAAVAEEDDGGDDDEPVAATEEELEDAKRQFAAACGKVRGVNDAINSLLRDVKRWDQRVVTLGGASTYHEPTQEHSFNGVAYFGAARQLPEYLKGLAKRHNAALLARRRRREDSDSAGPRPSQPPAEGVSQLEAAYVSDHEDDDDDEDGTRVVSTSPSAAAYDALISSNLGLSPRSRTGSTDIDGASRLVEYIGGCFNWQPSSSTTSASDSIRTTADLTRAKLLGHVPICATLGCLNGCKQCADTLWWNDAQLAAAASGEEPMDAENNDDDDDDHDEDDEDEPFIAFVPAVTEDELEKEAVARRREALRAKLHKLKEEGGRLAPGSR